MRGGEPEPIHSLFTSAVLSVADPRYVAKQYVAKDNVYDFGPLLQRPRTARDKDPQASPEETIFLRRHVETFRITNNSLFPVNLQACLASAQ